MLRERLIFRTKDGESVAGKNIAFISYRHIDKKYLKRIEDIIVSCSSYAVWSDEYLSVGEEFDSEIKEALKISHIFIQIITESYFEQNSYTYAEEMPLAKTLGLQTIAFICENISKDEYAVLQNNATYVCDLFKDGAIEDLIDFLESSRHNDNNEIQLKNISKKIDCSFITVNEMFELAQSYSNSLDVYIDREKAIKYATLANVLNLQGAEFLLNEDWYENGK